MFPTKSRLSCFLLGFVVANCGQTKNSEGESADSQQVSASGSELPGGVPAEQKSSMDAQATETKSDDEGVVYAVASCTKYPLVFHHGFMGGKSKGTFVGVEKQFAKRGCKILVTEVASVNTAEYRGKQLKKQIDDFLASNGADKVHIIAHSQGGLDARYAISMLGMDSKVASLSTLSTPHLGTPLADMALDKTGPLAQKAMAALLNLMGKVVNGNTPDADTLAAVNSLTTKYMTETFNEQVKDISGVIYQSWSARSGFGTDDKIKALLFPSHVMLNNNGGPNDGVVTVESGKWGNHQGTLDADHLDLIGVQIIDFLSPFKHEKFLDKLADDLMSQGL